jgi:hypothetical protein
MSPASPAPVERFKPTNGMLVGWFGLAFAAGVVVYCAVAVHSLAGVRVALAAVFLGTVVWMTQLRPRATAYPHHLLLRNAARDVVIPLAAIEEVSVRQTLRVYAGERRYDCIGIGVSRRELLGVRRRNTPSLLGEGRLLEFSRKHERASTAETGATYESFVVNRIGELAEREKREKQTPATAPSPRVRRQWAWAELAVLTASAVAFALTYLF